jgi:hypothetical protein
VPVLEPPGSVHSGNPDKRASQTAVRNLDSTTVKVYP